MRSFRRYRIALLAVGFLAAACMENDVVAPEDLDLEEITVYYPTRGASWEVRTPRASGWNEDDLTAAVDFAIANEADTPTDLTEYLESRFGDLPDQEILGPIRNRGPMSGMIVHRGYVVAEWGDTERADVAFSVTKSFLATTVGLALDRGLIASVDDRVAATVDDGGYDAPQNAAITWRHSLQQTSEWTGTLWDKPDTADRREGIDRELQPSGTFWEYNDVRVNRTALSATRVWGESLSDVVDREIMSKIGASRSWRWHGYRNSTVEIAEQEVDVVVGGGHWGGGLWISTRDLARFGLLWLRQGKWREEQLLSEEFVEQALTPSDLNPTYGFMWWLNTEAELWPAAPAESFAARGGGDNLLWIDPTRDIVVVVRWIQRGTEDEFLRRVIEAAD
jgi:CubicO group peptidase (beta-lactamase class C family)